MWTKIAFLVGLKVNESNQQEAGNNIVLMTQYVQKHYPNVTIQEMELAHELAIKGELPLKPKDDFKVFSMITPVQVSAILQRFQQYKTAQLKPVFTQGIFDEPPLPPPTPEELDVFHLEMLCKAFGAVNEGTVYMDWGNVLYDALDAKGLIYYSTPEKYEFLELAKSEAIAEQEQKVQGMLHTVLYKSALNVLESMKASDFNSLSLKAKAKNIALNQMVSELIEQLWEPQEFWAATAVDLFKANLLPRQ